MATLIALAPGVAIAIIWLAIAAFLRWRRGSSLLYLTLFVIFGVYLYAVLDVTLLQFQSLLVLKLVEPNIIIRGLEAEQSVNLVPLATLRASDLQTSLLNVVMLLPFGFGSPFITDFRFGKVVAAGAFFSLAIEAMQFFTGYIAGITFRVADLDDVLFNTIGTALGYLVFIAVVRVSRGLPGNRSNPLLAYVAGRPQFVARPR